MSEQLPTCVFCQIAAKQSPATIRYEDDEVIAFDNRLTWVPVMILVIPKRHMRQEELWANPIMSKIGAVAVELGSQLCPGGYRMLANVGRHGHQSQPHGHLHVLGGTDLGLYA